MTRDNQMLTIHHSLHLTKQYPVVFHEALGKNKQMRFAIEVEPDWLLEIAPMSSNEAGFENVRESVWERDVWVIAMPDKLKLIAMNK